MLDLSVNALITWLNQEASFAVATPDLYARLIAIAALLKAGQWQPIATAPEAEYVQVWLPNYGSVRALRTGNTWWNCGASEVCYPTHWMPDFLPPEDK